MSIIVPINGSNYIIPTPGETGWGSNLDSFFVAIGAGTLQKIGGSFLLSNEVDFGASFGLKALYFKDESIHPAISGVLLLGNGSPISWRNNANTGDLKLNTNTLDQLTYNNVPLATNVLTSSHIFVGNASNVATDVPMSGNIAIDNTGATTIQTGVVVNSMVNASAAIAFSKLAPLTNTHILVGNGSAIATDVALSGDATLANTGTLTLATVNANVGSFGSSSSVPQFTVNAKGLITAASTNTVVAPAGTLTGTTLASNVITSSLTAVGTITTGIWNGTPITVSFGGTGDTSFTAYSVICGGTTSTAALQNVSGVGLSGQVLTSGGTGTLPTWQNSAGTGTVGSGTAGNLTLYNASTNAVTDTYVQNAHNIILSIATQATRSTNLTVTIPNPGDAVTAANFVLSEGTATINGAKTFSSQINITATTNQLKLLTASTQNIIISGASTATADRTWTIPDISGNATFAALQGTQTFSGAKTFSSELVISASSGITFVVNTNDLIVDSTNHFVGIGNATPAAPLDIQVAQAATTFLRVLNDQASASGNAALLLATHDTSSGDPFVRYSTGGGFSWVSGMDVSDSQKYKISNGTALGTNDALIINNTSFAVAIHGTATNDNAAAGFVGETTSINATGQSFAASSSYSDFDAGLTLTAGDWLLTAIMNVVSGVATVTTVNLGISSTTGNSSTGLTSGDNLATATTNGVLSALDNISLVVPAYRVSLSATTNYYMKYRAIYSGGTPTADGRMSAVRIR